MKRLTLAAIFAGGFLLAACAGKECYENQNTLPLAGFRDMATHRAVTLSHLTVAGIGAPGDSLLTDSAAIEQVYLPFRPQSPSTSFEFRYGDTGVADTLTFYYATQPWFASEQCGVVYHFRVDSIRHTRYLMDSVAVPGGVITNVNGQNIEIYFREEAEQ